MTGLQISTHLHHLPFTTYWLRVTRTSEGALPELNHWNYYWNSIPPGLSPGCQLTGELEERQHKRRSKPIDNLFFKGCEQRQILPGLMALHLRHDRSSSTAPVQKASSKQKHSENPTESWHYIARADWVWSNLIMEIKTRGCTMEIYGKEYCRQLMCCTIIID